jgi:hypothetical protein
MEAFLVKADIFKADSLRGAGITPAGKHLKFAVIAEHMINRLEAAHNAHNVGVMIIRGLGDVHGLLRQPPAGGNPMSPPGALTRPPADSEGAETFEREMRGEKFSSISYALPDIDRVTLSKANLHPSRKCSQGADPFADAGLQISLVAFGGTQQESFETAQALGRIFCNAVDLRTGRQNRVEIATAQPTPHQATLLQEFRNVLGTRPTPGASGPMPGFGRGT